MSETATESDLQLLARYTRDNAEDAFTEIVRRHLDLVHSAGFRQVRSSQLAEEVAQSVFTDLARHAARLKPDTIVTAWLYQVTRRTAIDVVRGEARRQLREQIATEMNAMNATAADWTHIEPLLDEAMSALDDTDRAAVLLRYFENKSLREVGATLGTSDDAAQKRVSRAVEQLREFFAKRGVTVGAGGLAVVISANAVQAAPVGLAFTISNAAVLAGTTIVSTATSTVTQAIAMTTLQKTLAAVTIAAVVSTGIYEAHQASQLRGQVQTLQQQQGPLTGQIKQLQLEQQAAITRQALLQQENERLRQSVAGVPKLRGEVTQLRTTQLQQQQLKTAGVDVNDPATQQFLAAKKQAEQIARYMQQMPDKVIPEIKLLTDVDWLVATKEAKFDTDADIRQTLGNLRKLAKNRMPMGRALWNFTQANNGQLPADIAQLKPYFKSALGDTTLDDATLDSIFDRYKLLHTGNLSDLPPNAWIVAERTPVDKDYDSRAKFGNGTSTIINNGTARSYAEGESGDTGAKLH
ncbi:MAG: sigma-70 family RNA polymerase sigma factor [Opitutaceae bacterium]|nr:sigma-70 family RNA polymerase sigma factor [Verrucomicrobiales bacterium]